MPISFKPFTSPFFSKENQNMYIQSYVPTIIHLIAFNLLNIQTPSSLTKYKLLI